MSLFAAKVARYQRGTEFPVSLDEKEACWGTMEDTGWKTRAPFGFNDKDVDGLIEHFRGLSRASWCLFALALMRYCEGNTVDASRWIDRAGPIAGGMSRRK